MVNLEARLHRSSARSSDDVLLPFECENCRNEYADFPALIVVETSDEGTLRYCTDACAESAGWTEAVLARWQFEIRGESLSIIFIPTSYT